MRWEWRRGSTLFLVWQQDRSGGGLAGERVTATDLYRSFRSAGDNYFAMKATYWLSW